MHFLAQSQNNSPLAGDSCVEVTMSWTDAVLLVSGMFVIGIGIVSVLTKDEILCNAYGLAMLFFASIVVRE
eukprot:SAG31_NODE_26094_length_448_cov_1.166189_1_plen_71_part_00